MFRLSKKLEKYLDKAFTVTLDQTHFSESICTRFEENMCGIPARLYLNDELFIQTQMQYGQYIDVLYIEVTRYLPRLEEYITRSSPSYIGQRYLMDGTLGHFQRLFDMDCLDPIPPKNIMEHVKSRGFDVVLHELMIWNQEHVAEIDLFIMKSFTTTPTEIIERDYVGLIVNIEDGMIDC
ncbi:hypothetical protein VIBNIFTn2_120205 [Vibrio nigripulchritudo FTn2]|uniref:hypothetical protein n=1 Tax=Vibrio nigripulchritudo TaxID=28173 RepID=UPI0003B222ED|nr:hypothetical protein [Vibrio nigripulchritudo]CCN40223.1 hypothetical protein VIBNIFTn2_120205 [Vibrio nigripulchritudo FTn2]